MRDMKKLLLLPFIVILAMANQCDTDHKVSGTVGIEIELTEVEFAQINGINYIRTIQAGIVTGCMSIDPSTLYADTFQPITIQNAFRQTSYTAEELANCPQ